MRRLTALHMHDSLRAMLPLPRTGKRGIVFWFLGCLSLTGIMLGIFVLRSQRDPAIGGGRDAAATHKATGDEKNATASASADETAAVEKSAHPPARNVAGAARKESAADVAANTPAGSSSNPERRASASASREDDFRNPGKGSPDAGDQTKRTQRFRVDRPLDYDRLAEGIREKYALAAQRDPEADLALLRQRLDAGDSHAALALGLFLAYGDGFTPDPALAATYFEKAAGAGIARAQAELGRLYLSGNGVAADPTRAAELFRAAWTAGDPEGAFLLAAADRMKLFPGADPDEAAALFAAAADRGHVAAQKAIFDLSRSGGLSNNVATSEQLLAWLEQAAAAGDPDAAVSLAHEYSKTGRVDEAHTLLEKAAQAGSFNALEALMATTKIDARNPDTYRNIVRLLETHTTDPEQAPTEAFLMLAFFQSMVANDDATQARALETLRSAAARGNSQARLALQSAQRGELLVNAILEAHKLKEPDAYATWLQRGGSGTLENSPTDGAPVPMRTLQPTYPRELVAEHLGGSATVEFVVGADGRIVSTRVVNATHPGFGIAAEEAVKQWTFTPATKNGAPVTVKMQMPFTFRPPQ